MRYDPKTVLQGFDATIHPNGSITYRLRRSDGTDAIVTVPFLALTDFISGLEMQAGEALAKLNAKSGGDRRFMHPMKVRKVTKIQGGGSQGTPILTLILDGKLPLDIALPSDTIQDLIEYLQTLQAKASESSPPKSN